LTPVEKSSTKVQKPVKDLPGSIMTEVLTLMSKDPAFDNTMVNIFGKFIGQYVTTYIQTGQRNQSILILGFDLDQFNRRRNKKNKLNEDAKLELINKILQMIHRRIDAYYTTDLEALFTSNKAHLYELKTHLEVLIPLLSAEGT
jgi:hypothetical protein